MFEAVENALRAANRKVMAVRIEVDHVSKDHCARCCLRGLFHRAFESVREQGVCRLSRWRTGGSSRQSCTARR